MESKWEKEKDELERLINVEKVSYEEIGRRYGCSGENIKKVCRKIGVNLPQRRWINPSETFEYQQTIEETDKRSKLYNISDEDFIQAVNNFINWKQLYITLGYSGNPCNGLKEKIVRRCETLGIESPSTKSNFNKPPKRVCSKCGKPISSQNISGLCQDCYRKDADNRKLEKWLQTGDTGCQVSTTLRNCIRDYIFNSQSCKCAICGMNAEWNGKELHFVLDHIDGNAANNQQNNLRLICPNCDSQLDTFKSRNKESARTYRLK